MPKRFTDTDIWKNQRWFRKLSPIHKLIFYYVKDRCNHAGIWKIDCNDLIEDIGIESFDLENFIADINTEFDGFSGKKIIKDRIRIVKKNHLWITGFLQFQYEGKNKKVSWLGGPAYTAMLQLESFALVTEGLEKGYLTLNQPLFEGWQTHKDKDKEGDRDNYEGGSGETKILKNKQHGKNGKFSGNFDAQGAELLIQGSRERLAALERRGKGDNKSKT